MVCIASASAQPTTRSGRFIVGGAYRFREGNENYELTQIYTVAKRSAKFVTLVAVGSAQRPRRLAVRTAADGTECVLLGHRNACALRLLWSVNHVSPRTVTGWQTTTTVLPCVVKLEAS